MKRIFVSWALVVLLAATAAALQLSPMKVTPRYGPEAGDRPLRPQGRWHQGARGFEKAKEEAGRKGLPLAVYFYTDWCGYCRKFQSYLLDTSSVDAYLQGMVAVRINPEKGGDAMALARQYGIRGYPAFFLHPRPEAKPEALSPWIRDGRGSRMRTPGEFIGACKATVEKGSSASPEGASR